MVQKEIDKIKSLHMQMASERGKSKTYCPSEIAKKYDINHWRDYMNSVREVADELIADNKLVVLQHQTILRCKAVDAFGPIRLRLK